MTLLTKGDNSTKPLKWQVSYSVRGFGSVIQKCKHFCATLTLHTLDGGLADGAFGRFESQMRGSEIGLQAVLLHSPLAFVVLDGVALCPRRVDDEVHLLVQDDIENVRAAFVDLVHFFALHASLFVELGSAFDSVDLEAELLENTASRMSRQTACGLT